MKSTLKFLSGSAATYVLMAACSAASSGPAANSAAGAAEAVAGGAMGMSGAPQDGRPSSGGSSSAGASHSGVAGALGTIMDPVPDASAEPATDGSRLKAEYNVGADGSRQFVGWWDSQRNEECSFEQFSDGTQRCVPVYSGVIALGFSDSGCTSPLFAVAVSTCANPATIKYALGGAAWGCDGFSYAGVMSLTPTAPDKIFSGTPASCTDATAAYKATYNFYTGTEIPLSSFLAATKEHA